MRSSEFKLIRETPFAGASANRSGGSCRASENVWDLAGALLFLIDGSSFQGTSEFFTHFKMKTLYPS